MNRPIAEVEYALLVKFAADYLPMLEGSDADRAALEVIYKIGNGGIEQWVNERITNVLASARKLQDVHGPFTLAGVGASSAERLGRAGWGGFAKCVGDENDHFR